MDIIVNTLHKSDNKDNNNNNNNNNNNFISRFSVTRDLIRMLLPYYSITDCNPTFVYYVRQYASSILTLPLGKNHTTQQEKCFMGMYTYGNVCNELLFTTRICNCVRDVDVMPAISNMYFFHFLVFHPVEHTYTIKQIQSSATLYFTIMQLS
jgi:hypothetical protein